MFNSIKIFILFFVGVFSFAFTSAQTNLVPNFSFEQYSTCPNTADQIQFSSGWSKYSIPASTPDYYNACASFTSMGVPKSALINQQPHRNCSAYAALITWGASGNDREYIGIQLTQPLVVGQKYFLSFYTVMSESYYSGNYYGMPSNNIGLRLSTIPFSSSNPLPINNFAHLNSTSVVSDSINWQRISGKIIADSAYQYLILGNFFDDANTITVPYGCGSCLNVQSYYLFEDVCISTDSLLCNGGVDALSCSVSVSEIELNDQVKIFPNPSIDAITLSFQSNSWEEIKLSDLFGKNCLTEIVHGNDFITIDLSGFKAGVYILSVISADKNHIINKKIIKK